MKARPLLGARAERRGFTVVELLMALAIFAIGATGVLALQVVSSRANTHAKDLATATQLARSWQDKLAIDALLWNGGGGVWQLDRTEWVQQVDALNNQWFLPANDAAGTFGPATDAKGMYVDGVVQSDVYFCTHLRLTRLLPADQGGEVLRAEVRVFWPKGYQAWNGGADYCTPGANVGNIAAATSQFNFVYHTSVLRETPER